MTRGSDSGASCSFLCRPSQQTARSPANQSLLRESGVRMTGGFMSSSIKEYFRLCQKWGNYLLAHKNNYPCRNLSKVAAKKKKKMFKLGMSHWVQLYYFQDSLKWLVDSIESFPSQQGGTVQRGTETAWGSAQRFTWDAVRWQSLRLLKLQMTGPGAVIYPSTQASAEELLTSLFRCLSAVEERTTTNDWQFSYQLLWGWWNVWLSEDEWLELIQIG